MESKRLSTKIIGLITAGVIAALLLTYIGGFFYLRWYTLTSYEYLDCAESASSSQRLIQYFPEFLTRNAIDNDLLQECQAFEAATVLFGESSWEAAYTNYQNYIESYPDGHFLGTAQREAQKALFEWALILKKQGDFETAVEKFDVILSENVLFVEADVTKAKLDAMLALAIGLRASKSYDQAIAKIGQIQSTAQDAYPEITSAAQVELASNYLDWGKDWLAEKDYEAAKDKLTQAMQFDPNPDAVSSTGQQAKAAIANMYFQLAEEASAGKDYNSALENYRKSNEFADVANDPKLQQAIANVYIAWSGDYSVKEDFLGALDVLKESTKADKFDAARGSIDSALQKTYLAFSKSEGTQAMAAISDGIKNICEGKQPEVPIFGLDPDHKLIYLAGGKDEGVTESLPESLNATTPGTIHFVVCVQTGIDHLPNSVIDIPNWTLFFYRVDTLELVSQVYLPGTGPIGQEDYTVVPHSAGEGKWFYYVRGFGHYPKFSELVSWVTGVLKSITP